MTSSNRNPEQLFATLYNNHHQEMVKQTKSEKKKMTVLSTMLRNLNFNMSIL